jgi:hypothetical protein
LFLTAIIGYYMVLRRESRAATPVTGIILLVAITAILAATVSIYVFGLPESLADPAPAASFTAEQTEDTVRITHTSGETIEGDRLSIRGGTVTSIPETIEAGRSIEVTPSSETLTLIWENDETSAILATFNVTPATAGGGGINCTQTSVTIRSDINGDVVVSGSVTVRSGATINGDIRAGGAVDLRDPPNPVTVNGGVTAGGPVTQGSATVTGTIDDLRGGSYAPCST